jgi:transitional endoplasmic reticulum ATPase
MREGHFHLASVTPAGILVYRNNTGSLKSTNMPSSEDPLQALREALRLSPENVPLRQHLADSLLRQGQAEEAEKEYRQALAQAPDLQPLKIGLARAFYQQGKNTPALVVVEDLLKNPNTPPQAYVLHAQLLIRAGEIERAVRQYRQALELDPGAAVPELSEQLGLGPGNTSGEIIEGKVRAAYQEEGAAPRSEVERPTLTFQDVGGMDHLKEEIKLKIIYPLTHPELYKAYGKTVGGGILMYGPPGCGKTYLARATAGEVKAGFLAVGINDVLDMWIGSSERNLHELFEQAREHKPCVLFFDEVDALGASRSDLRQSAGRQLINQFLAELDGVNSANDGVLVLAATNAPWHLDPAFRRPGRFDRILFVPPPDATARASILRLQCRGKPVENPDYDYLAKKTESFSGADLKAVVDLAIEHKLREALKAGLPKPLATKDLQNAAATIRPSTKEWFATARNYALYANQGGIYDDIRKYLKF